MLKNKPTLVGRVTLWISLMACGLFITLSAMTLLVSLILEDAMIHNILGHVDQQEISLDGKVREVTTQELKNLGYQIRDEEDFTKRISGFGEFATDSEYYHFMISDDKILLLESTEFVATRERIESILKLLSFVFIPCLLLILVLARFIAKRALRPFSQLNTIFLDSERSTSELKKCSQQISELDVKQIALQLTQSLQIKESLLAEKVIFNQGMSHELRTPLQVMTHAIELIALKHPDLSQEDVYIRLLNASNRMRRVSEAMLWLGSDAIVEKPLQINTALLDIRKEVTNMFTSHGLIIDIQEADALCINLPLEVFEFIVFSLVTNVVHHGKEKAGRKVLNIDITANSICFQNLVGNRGSLQAQKNFGIGLVIVRKLCERFSLSYYSSEREDLYCVTLEVL
jgi:signal transduction histidine kinase